MSNVGLPGAGLDLPSCYPSLIETRDFGAGRTLVAESAWNWLLVREADGSLTLSVVCGTVGIFEVEVPVDSETLAAYEAEGEPAIERLARKVAYRPGDYGKL